MEKKSFFSYDKWHRLLRILSRLLNVKTTFSFVVDSTIHEFIILLWHVREECFARSKFLKFYYREAADKKGDSEKNSTDEITLA